MDTGSSEQELSEMECQLPGWTQAGEPLSSLPDVSSGKVQAKPKHLVCLERYAF